MTESLQNIYTCKGEIKHKDLPPTFCETPCGLSVTEGVVPNRCIKKPEKKIVHNNDSNADIPEKITYLSKWVLVRVKRMMNTETFIPAVPVIENQGKTLTQKINQEIQDKKEKLSMETLPAVIPDNGKFVELETVKETVKVCEHKFPNMALTSACIQCGKTVKEVKFPDME